MSEAPVKKQQPPLPPASNHNELIHDVEETLKQQQLERLWKDYGSWIIGGIIALILTTGAVSGWNAYQYKKNAGQTAALMTAMEAKDADLAAALGEVVPSLESGHRAMAYLRQAGELLRAGKKEEALAVYKSAVGDNDLPAQWHDLAVLLSVRTQWALEDGKAENGARALLDSLSPLTGNAKSPWHFHARVQAALIAAHGLSDYETARAHLSAVEQARDIPPSLKERAKALNHIYSIRAAEVKKEPKG